MDFSAALRAFFHAVPPSLLRSGRLAAEADVFADEVGLFDRHAEQRAVAVFETQFLAVVALLDAAEAADAVFVVDDEIALFHFVDGGAGAGGAGLVERGCGGRRRACGSGRRVRRRKARRA